MVWETWIAGGCLALLPDASGPWGDKVGSGVPALVTEKLRGRQVQLRRPQRAELGKQLTPPLFRPRESSLPSHFALTSAAVPQREGGFSPRPTRPRGLLLLAPTPPALPAPQPQAGLLSSCFWARPQAQPWAQCKDSFQEEGGSA